MPDTDLTMLQQQQNSMIIEMRALIATVRRMDESTAAALRRVEDGQRGIEEGQRRLEDEMRATNRKIDDIAARLGNLEVAR